MKQVQTPRRRGERVLVAAYVVLAASPLVYLAVSDHRFWDDNYRLAPIAGVILGCLWIQLLRRRRWAWLVLVTLELLGLAGSIANPPHVATLAAQICAAVILLCAPTRPYVLARP